MQVKGIYLSTALMLDFGNETVSDTVCFANTGVFQLLVYSVIYISTVLKQTIHMSNIQKYINIYAQFKEN